MSDTAIQCFWTVMDAPGVRAGPVPPGLLAVLEDDVPVPTEQLWAVGAPGKDGRYIVCAARRDDLNAVPPGTMALTPPQVPEFVSVPASSFNLLVGEFEPVAIRRSRRRKHLIAAPAMLLGCSLIGIGLSRRAQAWNSEITSLKSQTWAVVASVAPSALWTADDLAMELSQKRHAVPEDFKLPGDAALTLSSVIASWPKQMQVKAQTLAATGDSASLSVTVPGDPSAFLMAFKPPEGWRLEEPRLSAIDKA